MWLDSLLQWVMKFYILRLYLLDYRFPEYMIPLKGHMSAFCPPKLATIVQVVESWYVQTNFKIQLLSFTIFIYLDTKSLWHPLQDFCNRCYLNKNNFVVILIFHVHNGVLRQKISYAVIWIIQRLILFLNFVLHDTF